MGQASNSINVPVVTTPGFGIGGSRIVRFLPAILPIVGALLMLAARRSSAPEQYRTMAP